MAKPYKGGAAGGRKPRSASILNLCDLSEGECCVCVRSDVQAIELIVLVDGDPDSRVLMAPVQAVELAARLLVASQRVDQLVASTTMVRIGAGRERGAIRDHAGRGRGRGRYVRTGASRRRSLGEN